MQGLEGTVHTSRMLGRALPYRDTSYLHQWYLILFQLLFVCSLLQIFNEVLPINEAYTNSFQRMLWPTVCPCLALIGQPRHTHETRETLVC
jgi:hypothetical protein